MVTKAFDVMTSTWPLGSFNSVASWLAATHYQEHHEWNHTLVADFVLKIPKKNEDNLDRFYHFTFLYINAVLLSIISRSSILMLSFYLIYASII
jgi:hypothetical protein